MFASGKVQHLSDKKQKNRKATIGYFPVFIFCAFIAQRVYASWIASLGQVSAQVPQLMQVSGSMLYLSPSEIASTGQTDAQLPHAIQLSLITYAILLRI